MAGTSVSAVLSLIVAACSRSVWEDTGPMPPSHGRTTLWRRPAVAVVIAAIVAVACTKSSAGTSTSPTSPLSPAAPSSPWPTPAKTGPLPDHATQLRLARQKITKVVFLVKENRTLDTLFGLFPGADGATSGQLCDGTTIPLAQAHDNSPGAKHSFTSGIEAIDGGKMDCFDQAEGGEGGATYVQYHGDQIPNYWSYAQHFTLGDRFFSSAYGPTFVEHFWLVADSTNRFLSNEHPDQGGTNGIQGEYCDDPTELMDSFPV